jgi:tetratricopeptide (TPR) repeat protein
LRGLKNHAGLCSRREVSPDPTDNPRMKQKPRTSEPVDPAAAAAGASTDPFRLGPIAIDLRDVLGDALDAPLPDASTEPGEIDLSDALAGLEEGAAADDRSTFKAFHDEVGRDTRVADAARRYKIALVYQAMNMLPEAVRELEVAARVPRLRFDAAALLARLALEQGRTPLAIEWFERAAETPATSTDAARGVLYDLADALERQGEHARALALFRELEHDAPRYRDVAARVGRLAAR